MDKFYLGDSVYVELDEVTGMLKLTTENGLPDDPSNTIYLEDAVFEVLIKYVKRMKEKYS